MGTLRNLVEHLARNYIVILTNAMDTVLYRLLEAVDLRTCYAVQLPLLEVRFNVSLRIWNVF